MEKFTIENWGSAPYNRWSFQKVQELFPTTRIRRDASRAELRECRHADLSAIEFDGFESRRTIGEMLQDTYTDAFLVSHRGELIAESYTLGMNVDQHHLTNSVTKSFIGMLAGIAVDRGVFDVDAPIVVLIPELEGNAWDGTTGRHLLDMSAGVSYAEEYDDSQTDFWKEAAVVGWRPALLGPSTPKNLLAFAGSLKGKNFNNGDKFSYKTVCTNVLGLVLERAMGAPLSTLLTDHIWAKLPMRCDASIVVDETRFPYVGAGMSACARDLLTFGQLMIDDGACANEQIIPEAWVRDTREGNAAVKAQAAASDYAEMLAGWHYRNQVWSTDTPGVMLAMGIHGQMIYMDTDAQVVVIKFSSHPDPSDVMRISDAFIGARAIACELEKSS